MVGTDKPQALPSHLYDQLQNIVSAGKWKFEEAAKRPDAPKTATYQKLMTLISLGLCEKVVAGDGWYCVPTDEGRAALTTAAQSENAAIKTFKQVQSFQSVEECRKFIVNRFAGDGDLQRVLFFLCDSVQKKAVTKTPEVTPEVPPKSPDKAK